MPSGCCARRVSRCMAAAPGWQLLLMDDYQVLVHSLDDLSMMHPRCSTPHSKLLHHLSLEPQQNPPLTPTLTATSPLFHCPHLMICSMAGKSCCIKSCGWTSLCEASPLSNWDCEAAS
jgi:hypothetical protein